MSMGLRGPQGLPLGDPEQPQSHLTSIESSFGDGVKIFIAS